MNQIEIVPPKKPIQGRIKIGGSKSYTNRALIIAALANGKSKLVSLSKSDDSNVLIDALKQLGVVISQTGRDEIEVHGCGGHFKRRSISLDVGHAGTAMRFLTSLCCLVPGIIHIDGSDRMRKRPIGDLVDALRLLDLDITYDAGHGCPPLTIQGGTLLKSCVSLSGMISSQFISSLLLIAPALQNGLEINIQGTQISKSYIDMTIGCMKEFGVTVTNDNYKKYMVGPTQKYHATEYEIEGDASGASYLFALAALNRGTITIENINPGSAQGDVHFADILEKMGCIVTKDFNRKSITVSATKKLNAVSVDMSAMPDTAQTLAVIAAFAQGTTHITGLSSLRVKETDRLAALKHELSKLGIASSITHDSITIIGGVPHGARIETYNDHRMALSFSAAGVAVKGVRIEDSEVVSKSFPDYWKKLASLGVGIKKI